MFSSTFNAVIFDLGDVLFSWSSQTKTSISSRTLRRILSSPAWFDYERGRLTQTECYNLVAEEFTLEPVEIFHAFEQARDSLQSNSSLISLIRKLKETDSEIRVFAMSNISLPDYEVLRTKPADWSIFDQVFTSAAIGERKPDLGIYRHVLAAANLDPCRTIFVDDKLENVLSARSLGIHGIVFSDTTSVSRALQNLIGDPVSRGREFLFNNAGRLDSVTDSGLELKENFAQLLILETTGDRNLVNLVDHSQAWNFFVGNPILTTEKFPPDLDTTSLAFTILKHDHSLVSSIMDEMLLYLNQDGIIQTYFDNKRPRFDPVVCVNVLSLFYMYGRDYQLERTLEWVHDVLLNRAYLDGTRYYETPESFLFFLSRLLSLSDSMELHNTIEPLLRERVQERIGAGGDALALSMRLLACDFLGLRNEADLRILKSLQCEDGGWETGWIYKYGVSGVKIGNRGLTSALAVKAIEAMRGSSLYAQTVSVNVHGSGDLLRLPQTLHKSCLNSSNLRTDSPMLQKTDSRVGDPRPDRSLAHVKLRQSLSRLLYGGKQRKVKEV